MKNIIFYLSKPWKCLIFRSFISPQQTDHVKILICDDDRDILEVTKQILEMRGAIVETRTDSHNICEVVTQLKPDLVLMDLWIEPSGEQAIRDLKSNKDTRRVPVVVFSAINNADVMAARAGANGYVSKPYSIEDIDDLAEGKYKKIAKKI